MIDSIRTLTLVKENQNKFLEVKIDDKLWKSPMNNKCKQ